VEHPALTQRRAILFLKNIPEIFSLGVTFGDEKIEGEETPTAGVGVSVSSKIRRVRPYSGST